MEGSKAEKYKVMIVEDSSLIRGYLTRALQVDSDIEVCGVVENGQIAVDIVNECKPEIILLDIEMPVMDGITALPILRSRRPEAKIIMISTLTTHNAAISIEAMSKGATDYLEKPSAEMDKTVFKEELIQKIRVIADSARMHATKYEIDSEFGFLKSKSSKTFETKPSSVQTESKESVKESIKIEPEPIAVNNYANNEAPKVVPVEAEKTVESDEEVEVEFVNDDSRFAGFKPDVLAVGSSTGGPHALQEVFSQIGNSLDHIPIFITQHMPPKFTSFLAKSIENASGATCVEPKDGQKVEKGVIYLAPGDYHMLVETKGVDKHIKLTKGEPENFCRPAVDPMLRSLVEVYGKNILTVIMTGMGRDGADGAKIVREKGGKIIIQDEESSVVWGMPGAVASERLQDGVYPCGELAQQIIKICKGDV